MTKANSIIVTSIITFLTISCNEQANKVYNKQADKDTVATLNQSNPNYKALQYIDSFIAKNGNEIKKNNALKEHYEGLCTKQILPLIDKKGLYDDIPFKLVATTTHNGLAYGNFVYDDGKHFIKVTCIIKEKQLLNLKEDNQYLIKFKTAKFQDGISFENEFSKIELPIVSAYLISFTDCTK